MVMFLEKTFKCCIEAGFFSFVLIMWFPSFLEPDGIIIPEIYEVFMGFKVVHFPYNVICCS
jgi:hypothetical protein